MEVAVAGMFENVEEAWFVENLKAFIHGDGDNIFISLSHQYKLDHDALKVCALEMSIKRKFLSILTLVSLCLDINELDGGLYEEVVKDSVAATYTPKELRTAFTDFDLSLQQNAQGLFEVFLF